MLSIRIHGVHPDLLWLVPITAAILDGPETGAIAGFWSGLAFDLILPTPFGLSALVGCILGYAVGSATKAVDREAALVDAGGRGHWERRSGHAVRRARWNLRTAADGADRFHRPRRRRRRLERPSRAPGQLGDAMGPVPRRDVPIIGLGAQHQRADHGEAFAPPSHPRRSALSQATATTSPRDEALAGTTAAHAAPPGPKRRRAGRFARGGDLSSQSPTPRRRDRRARALRRPRGSPVDPAGDRRQDLRGPGHPQPGPGGRGVTVARPDRRPQQHRPGRRPTAGGDPPLAGLGRAEPLGRRQGGRVDREDTDAGADDRQQRSVRSVRAHTAGHGDTGRHGAVPPGPPVRLPGRVGGAGHHAYLPAGREHGGPCTGLPRRHHQHLSQCAQERRVRPRQPGGDIGHRGAVRDLPTRGQRAPGARGGRVGQRGRHRSRAPPRRRATRWC